MVFPPISDFMQRWLSISAETEARQRVVGLDDANLPAHMFVHLAAFHARQGNMSVMEDIVTSRLSRINKARIIANLREQAGTRPNVQELIASGIVAMALDNAESTSSRSLSARLRLPCSFIKRQFCQIAGAAA